MFRDALIVITVSIPVLAAHAQQPEPFASSERKQVTATVESIDSSKRTIVLADADGARTLIVAGPEVRNLDQIEPGDRIIANYHEAIAAEVKPKGEGAQGVSASVATKRTSEGQRPAGAVGASIAATVRVESVDTSFDTVTFKRSDGIVRTVAVEDPDAKRFIGDLEPGNEVQITYTEATAVSLEPTQR